MAACLPREREQAEVPRGTDLTRGRDQHSTVLIISTLSKHNLSLGQLTYQVTLCFPVIGNDAKARECSKQSLTSTIFNCFKYFPFSSQNSLSAAKWCINQFSWITLKFSPTWWSHLFPQVNASFHSINDCFTVVLSLMIHSSLH